MRSMRAIDLAPTWPCCSSTLRRASPRTGHASWQSLYVLNVQQKRCRAHQQVGCSEGQQHPDERYAAPCVRRNSISGLRAGALHQRQDTPAPPGVADGAGGRRGAGIASTGEVNQVLQDAYNAIQVPTRQGRLLRIYYGTQGRQRPAHLVIFVNNERCTSPMPATWRTRFAPISPSREHPSLAFRCAQPQRRLVQQTAGHANDFALHIIELRAPHRDAACPRSLSLATWGTAAASDRGQRAVLGRGIGQRQPATGVWPAHHWHRCQPANGRLAHRAVAIAGLGCGDPALYDQRAGAGRNIVAVRSRTAGAGCHADHALRHGWLPISIRTRRCRQEPVPVPTTAHRDRRSCWNWRARWMSTQRSTRSGLAF